MPPGIHLGEVQTRYHLCGHGKPGQSCPPPEGGRPRDLYAVRLPCQLLSRAGKNLGEGDTADDRSRGVLFNAAHDFIANRCPRSFLIESMGNIVERHRAVFTSWLKMLHGGLRQYSIYWVIHTADHRLPNAMAGYTL